MTAIVGTINRRGIAFAADSAATHTVSSKHKITNHANKIFELSKHHPVGVAICGNLDFLGLPWEEIFKLYRNHLKTEFKPFLSDYSTNFLEFVQNRIMPNLMERQETDLYFVIDSFWKEIVCLANKDIDNSEGKLNKSDIYRIILQKLEHFSTLYQTSDKCLGLEEYKLERFIEYSQSHIDSVLKDHISTTDCPGNLRDLFAKTLFEIICSNIHAYIVSTEVIIWGYGEDDLFPSYESFVISLTFDNTIRYTAKSKYKVSNDNVACVEPFAQTDVANTVVRGIDDELRTKFFHTYKASLDGFKNEIISKLETSNAPIEFIDIFRNLDTETYTQSYATCMNEYIQTYYIDKLVNTISYLSKEDLADMAESLVRMTYLKRRITSEEESVGGPVDVAVITKGDGFIWLKRKHYFSPELNPHYFNR